MPRKAKSKKVVESEESTEEVESPVESEEVEEVEETPKSPVKKVKVKRAPSAYNLFVKEHISQFKDFAPRERMSKVSELWKKEKSKK